MTGMTASQGNTGSCNPHEVRGTVDTLSITWESEGKKSYGFMDEGKSSLFTLPPLVVQLSSRLLLSQDALSVSSWCHWQHRGIWERSPFPRGPC
jgi:hypothetical protein